MRYIKFDTLLGQMLLLANADDIAGLCFADQPSCPATDEMAYAKNDSDLIGYAKQVQDYFAGKRQTFSIPLSTGGTFFQQQVWQAVQQIGFGQTISYLALARSLGKESAVRAVGSAIGKNPVLLLTPCHRIVGSNGALTGFSGGIERKRQLLELESKWAKNLFKVLHPA